MYDNLIVIKITSPKPSVELVTLMINLFCDFFFFIFCGSIYFEPPGRSEPMWAKNSKILDEASCLRLTFDQSEAVKAMVLAEAPSDYLQYWIEAILGNTRVRCSFVGL